MIITKKYNNICWLIIKNILEYGNNVIKELYAKNNFFGTIINYLINL